MVDPQQELFSRLKTDIEKLGFPVYDGALPPDGTPYPFVYIGNSTQRDITNKSAVHGIVDQTIHVWSDSPEKRGTFSRILAGVKGVVYNVESTDCFSWNLMNVNQQILEDKTTATPLMHGVIEAEYRFS